jgi:hypothetical protein
VTLQLKQRYLVIERLTNSVDSLSVNLAQIAKDQLRKLKVNAGKDKQTLYDDCEQNPVSYPLKIALPDFASPSLLDHVQGIQDVDGNIRQLKRQRTGGRDYAVYIQPRAKSSAQASADSGFLLIDKVKEFLRNHQQVFLLLGDSGAGKSTLPVSSSVSCGSCTRTIMIGSRSISTCLRSTSRNTI